MSQDFARWLTCLGVLLVLVLSVRRLLRTAKTASTDGFVLDAAYHLLLIQNSRRARSERRGERQNLLHPTLDMYPNLLHRSASFLKIAISGDRPWVALVPWYSASVLAVGWVSVSGSTAELDLSFAGALSFFMVAFAGPSNSWNSALVFGLSERGPAKIVSSLVVLLVLVLGSTDLRNHEGILAVLLVSLFIIQNKLSLFGRQVCIFVEAPLCLIVFFQSPIPLSCLAIAFIFQYSFPVGETRSSFRAHFEFSRAYRAFVAQSSHMFPLRRPKGRGFWWKLKTYSKQLGFNFFVECLVLFSLVSAGLAQVVAGEGEPRRYLTLVGSVLVTFLTSVLFSLRKLRFLGEGWRYSNYSVPGLVAFGVLSGVISARVVFILGVLLMVLDNLRPRGKGESKNTTFDRAESRLDKFFEFHGLSSTDSTLTQPINYGAAVAAQSASKTWFLPGTYSREHGEFLRSYPWLPEPLFRSIASELATALWLDSEWVVANSSWFGPFASKEGFEYCGKILGMELFSRPGLPSGPVSP